MTSGNIPPSPTYSCVRSDEHEAKERCGRRSREEARIEVKRDTVENAKRKACEGKEKRQESRRRQNGRMDTSGRMMEENERSR
jgi:hypothetical protein